MATIILRGSKLSPLTNAEVDANFNNINVEVLSIINTMLPLKAPLASPALTGTPTAPTAALNTNTTQLATTAFVIGQAGTASPLQVGVSAVGTSTKFAREDHSHSTNATNLNTASTIVSRDASGNFSAGTITAALNGNASTATTATTLATARTINGTSFNGSANITTANWGTSRTVTIGNTGKAVNGSANVSWSLAEIGADNASNLVTGTIPDARISGTYSGFTHKIDGSNTVFTTPSTGTTSTNARTVYGLAEYKSDVASQVGAIVFIAPDTSSSIMHQIEVSALLHNQSIVVQRVQGYRTTGTWSSTQKVSTGSADIQTRWGVTPDGRNCLILGDVATAWPYPHISITKAMFSYTGVTDAYCTGWTVAVVTDLSAYTNVTATIPDSPMTGSITGNAATATTLQTARTISLTGDVTGSVSFNGSANVSITATVADDSHNHIISNVDGLQTVLDLKVDKDSNTGSASLPAGTTAQRTASPAMGALRFNSTLTQFEGYNGTEWGTVGGGATGAAGNYVFNLNDQYVTGSYSIPVGKNAMSAGPIIVNDGVTVTIPNGSVWTVV